MCDWEYYSYGASGFMGLCLEYKKSVYGVIDDVDKIYKRDSEF